MPTTPSEAHGIAHAVALSRLQARRGDAAAPLLASANAGFADTVPLWFRSEAFAEDVSDAACTSAAHRPAARPHHMRRIDAQMMAAGAAVLRLTLQALHLQRRN
jgi:hypothetical protein